MHKVKQSDNVPLVGLTKTQNGDLVVDDRAAYNKYKIERQLHMRVSRLEEHVIVLQTLLKQSSACDTCNCKRIKEKDTTDVS